jgi:hypothetical protein
LADSINAGYELITTAATTSLEVLEVHEDGSSMRIDLRIPEEDVPDAALAVLFAFAVLSFTEARPIGASELDYQGEDDEWTVDDLVRHLRFERGHLVLDADYVRGRRMKTTIDVAPGGQIALSVRDRGAVARRWVAKMKGKVRHLAVVDPTAPRFLTPEGKPLPVEDWAGVPFAVAHAWADAEEEVPDEVSAVLEQEPALAGLYFERGVLSEHVPTPDAFEPVIVPLTVYLEDELDNQVAVVVVGVDERGLGPTCADWLVESPNRERQLGRFLDDLVFDIDRPPDALDLSYRLVEQAWAAVQQAADRRCATAVVLVQGVGPSDCRPDVAGLARLFGVELPPEDGRPVRLSDGIDGVSLWLASSPLPGPIH